jgi:hypothetical protein
LYAASTSPAPPTVILPTALNNKKGYQYICTTGGTSGSTEPAWPLSGTVTDGGVIWTYSGLTPRNWVAGFYYTVNAVVYPKNGNGYQYICTTAGTSGTVATEPTWPLSGTVIETTGVQWSYRGPQPTLALQTRIGNEGSEYTNQTFGGDPQVKYRVIHNRFITFVSNTERSTVVAPGEDDYGKYLKVTIGLHSNDAPRTDETLTTLFVRR